MRIGILRVLLGLLRMLLALDMVILAMSLGGGAVGLGGVLVVLSRLVVFVSHMTVLGVGAEKFGCLQVEFNSGRMLRQWWSNKEALGTELIGRAR